MRNKPPKAKLAKAEKDALKKAKDHGKAFMRAFSKCDHFPSVGS